jgi:hypothetical protein
MRENLKEFNEVRIKVYAEVGRYGTKSSFGYTKETICLVNIKDERGKILCDHLWLTVGKQIKELKLVIGDIVYFQARVTKYYKGYKGYRDDVNKPIELDYRLSNPTKFYKI